MPAPAKSDAASNAPTHAAELPPRLDRRTAAAVVTARFSPVSYRTLESWPITSRIVNGRAVIETAELLAFARAKLDAAPVIRGGRTRT